jgi:hypothetical protein
VIVSDNDPQSKDAKTGALQFHPDGRPIHRGQDHAVRVVKHMRKVAAHARTVIFPQKDLTAWVEAGGTRAALEDLIEAAPDQSKQPEPKIADPNESDPAEILAELNRDNAVVLDCGRTMVLRFEELPHEAGGERYTYHLPAFLRFPDFRNFHLNRYIDVGDDKVSSIGTWWLAHPDRRQYRGVIFTPGGKPIIDGRLNLWRGWGVEPKRGDWVLLREHIYEVLAARNDDVDTYIIRWLAWTVQHPAEQAEVAVVFLGGIGTGKGTLGKAMCRIFGQHSRHLSSPEHLTGRFNAHLRQCCFLFGDECYGPKDKSAEGTLKRLITEPTLQIEPKGRDAIEEPNRLHVMLPRTTNGWSRQARTSGDTLCRQWPTPIDRAQTGLDRSIRKYAPAGSKPCYMTCWSTTWATGTRARSCAPRRWSGSRKKASPHSTSGGLSFCKQACSKELTKPHPTGRSATVTRKRSPILMARRAAHAHGVARGPLRSGQAHLAKAQRRQRYRPWPLSMSSAGARTHGCGDAAAGNSRR